MNKIIVQRAKKTVDATLGNLSLTFNPFTCFSLENLGLEIPAGVWKVTIDYSPDFNRRMPHIWCTPRDQAAQAQGAENAGLRIHWGNLPKNYKGCVGVGDKEEPDAIDDTITTFNQLFKIIDVPEIIADLWLDIRDIPA
jgi:hypothetical protein